ncbi:MAG: hypothetical protein ACLU3F_15680 [Blautia wexlerae]
MEALRARVFEAADEVQLEQISADQQSLYLLVFVHKCAAEAVGAALREAGFALTTFDGVQARRRRISAGPTRPLPPANSRTPKSLRS